MLFIILNTGSQNVSKKQNFIQPGCPSYCQTNSVQTQKADNNSYGKARKVSVDLNPNSFIHSFIIKIVHVVHQ